MSDFLRRNPQQTGTPANSAFQSYAVMGGVNQRSAPAASSIVVNFPAAGVYPYEVDYAKGGDNNLTLAMTAGGAPIPAAVLLTMTPNTEPSTTAGQFVALTIQARDLNGAALPNVPLSVTVAGVNSWVNSEVRTLVTDGTGQANFAYSGSRFVFGNDQVQAQATVKGATAVSNVVSITWNSGVNQAPTVEAGLAQTIQLSGSASLSGIVGDDGLPSNTLSTTWSMVSGPGVVTFAAASQVTTTATFSAIGTYVLQLSAFDGALTSTSTVTITVVANPPWASGWLASPINGITVSAPTQISLVSGITLTSGTLSIYPASNPTAITVLSTNTTGSGQIGTFDPTLLANGSYVVDLRATNSAGVTQDNLALVKVIGVYKPGRVTATVTDFTVPAPGLPIQIQRTYDSLVRSTPADFGYGWTLGVNIQTDISPTGAVTLTLNGQRKTFYFTPPANDFRLLVHAAIYGGAGILWVAGEYGRQLQWRPPKRGKYLAVRHQQCREQLSADWL